MRLAALRTAALGAACVAAAIPAVAAAPAIAAAMPLREGVGLVVSCGITGLPRGEVAAAESALCTRVIERARQGAPYPVTAGSTADAVAVRLSVRAAVAGSTPETRLIRIVAELARPGQPAAGPLTARPPPAAYRDQAAVEAAIDAALAAVLPWRHSRRAPVPRPPRAY